MKIVINAIPLLSPLTGIGTYTHEVSKAFQKFDLKNEYYYFYGYFSRNLAQIGAAGGGCQYHLKELVKRIPVADAVARRMKGIFTAFSGREFDLYFEPNFVPINIRSRRLVTTVADFSFHFHPEWHPKSRTNYFRKNFWDKIKRADRIIVISDFIRKEAIGLGLPEEKFRTIYLGYDQEAFRVYASSEAVRKKFDLPEKFILYVGSIEPRKNLLRLLQAYLALPAIMRKDYRMVLAGFKGWENQEIIKLLEQGKEDFIYLGYTSKEELGQLYNLATIFVYPSLYEGFGLPALEAMACGCPVLTSNVASLPEVCSNAAYYINPTDTEDINKGIAQLLADNGLRQDLKEKGLDRARFFSWDKSAREHLEVFEECFL